MKPSCRQQRLVGKGRWLPAIGSGLSGRLNSFLPVAGAY